MIFSQMDPHDHHNIWRTQSSTSKQLVGSVCVCFVEVGFGGKLQVGTGFYVWVDPRKDQILWGSWS